MGVSGEKTQCLMLLLLAAIATRELDLVALLDRHFPTVKFN